MSNIKLLPCPFCGENDIEIKEVDCGGFWSYYVTCEGCGTIGNTIDVPSTKNNKYHLLAIKKVSIHWNYRVPAKELK